MHDVRVNAPRMVHETVDGEVIVIDLATGAYYSLPGSASEIWQSIIAGGSREDITARVSERHSEESASIQATLDGFLDRLLDEGLIVTGSAAPDSVAPTGASDERPATPWSKPVVEKYTDMADLILLDPVHDVSSLGWPDLPDDRSSNP